MKNISPSSLQKGLLLLFLLYYCNSENFFKRKDVNQSSTFPILANALSTHTITSTTINFRSKIRYSENDDKEYDEYSSSNRINKTINPIDIPYSSAIKVLQTYKTLNGNLALPRRYTIPQSQKHLYPPEWHKLDISRIYDMKWWQTHVHKHPSRVSQLNQLGFLWERLQPEWNLVLQALIVYKSIYCSSHAENALMVPVSFVVPYNNTAWPQSTWGLHLGNQVYRIRTRQDFIKGGDQSCYNRVAQLNGLGFVWDVQEYNFQKVVDALICYKRVVQSKHGVGSKVIKVPTTFVVPNTTSYPNYLWGFPLGAKCCAIRSKQLYIKDNKQRKQVLEDVGFNFKGNAALGWLDVVHALAIYSRLHNSDNDALGGRGKGLCVPQNFVVPEQPSCTLSSSYDWPWPEQLWGLPLGQRIRDIKSKGRYLKGKSATERKAQLYSLGYAIFDDDYTDAKIQSTSLKNERIR